MAGKDNDVGADIRMSALLVSALVKASNDELETFVAKRQSLDVGAQQIRQVRDLIRELAALLKDSDDRRWGAVDDAYVAIVGDRGDEPEVSRAEAMEDVPDVDALVDEQPLVRAEHPEIQRPPALGELLGAVEGGAPSVRAPSAPSPWVEPSRALQAKARASQPVMLAPSEPTVPARVLAPLVDRQGDPRQHAEAAAALEPRTGTMVPPPPDSVRPEDNGLVDLGQENVAAPSVVPEAGSDGMVFEPSGGGGHAAPAPVGRMTTAIPAADRVATAPEGLEPRAGEPTSSASPSGRPVPEPMTNDRRRSDPVQPEPVRPRPVLASVSDENLNDGDAIDSPVDATTVEGRARNDGRIDPPARVGSGTEPPADENDDDLDETEERARSSTLPPMAMNDEALPFPTAFPHPEIPSGSKLPPEALANVIAGLPPMTVVSYAALAASGDAFPQRIAETHAKFGVTNGPARAALDAVWHAKLDGDPRLRALWTTLHDQFASWLSLLQ